MADVMTAIFRMLKLLSQSSNGNVELLAVFCNRTSRNIVAFVPEKIGQLLIGQWFLLVLGAYAVEENFLDLSGGNLLAAIGRKRLAEK